MDIYKKIGIVAGQVYLGLGFAIFGVVAEVIVISLTRDRYVDAFGTIMSSWIGFMFGLLIGNGLFGYRFLKAECRQNEFSIFLLISVIGTCGGFFGRYFISSNHLSFLLPSAVDYFIILALPFSGIALSSILVLTRDKKRKTV